MEWLVVGAEQAQEAIRRAFFYVYILRGLIRGVFLQYIKWGLFLWGKRGTGMCVYCDWIVIRDAWRRLWGERVCACCPVCVL